MSTRSTVRAAKDYGFYLEGAQKALRLSPASAGVGSQWRRPASTTSSRSAAVHATTANHWRPGVGTIVKRFQMPCSTLQALPPNTSGTVDPPGDSNHRAGAIDNTAEYTSKYDLATSVHEVLGLLKDSSAALPGSQAPVCAAALRALARCFAPIASAASAANADATDVCTVLPALTSLVPYTNYDVYGRVIPERVQRAVLASGLSAGLSALTETSSSWGAASYFAVAASDSMATLLPQVVPEVVTKAQPSSGKANSSRRKKPRAPPPPQGAGGTANGAGGSTGVGPSPPLSGEEGMQLAAALIAAGARQTLPRPVAALLLRLLSTDGVLPLLPDWALQQALLHVLPEVGLPLADDLTTALDARMRSANTRCSSSTGSGGGHSALASAVSRAAVLRRCGASAVHSQRALLQLTEYDVQQLSTQQALEVLSELEACDVREQLALAQRPLFRDAESAYGEAEGPCAQLAERTLRQLANLASQREVGFADATAALRHLATLRRRLEGLHSVPLYQGVVALLEHVVGLRSQSELEEEVRRDTPGVWALLQAAQEMGAAHLNRLLYQVVARRAKWVDFVVRARAEDPRNIAGERSVVHLMMSAIGSVGPYCITAGSALRLWKALTPLLSGCTARELGLLYGALALRNECNSRGREGELGQAVRQVEPLYKAALSRLATRTDMPPLMHLNVLLDALEPAMLADPLNCHVDLRPKDLYCTSLRVADLLLEPLARFMTDPRVASERVPPGVAPWDDRQLVRSPVELSEELLLGSLFARDLDPGRGKGGLYFCGAPRTLEIVLRDVDTAAGTFHCAPERWPLVPLPLALRPPAGQRHGMPGGDGRDGEREAYVRSIAPVLVTAQRLARLTLITSRGPEIQTALEAKPGVGKAVAECRWVTAMAFAVLDAWGEQRVQARMYAGVDPDYMKHMLTACMLRGEQALPDWGRALRGLRMAG